MKDEILLTKEGLQKLKSELDELKKVKRPEIIKRIQIAREFGDLSENAEYEDAKNQQSFTEGRIQDLEDRLKRVTIINENKGSASSVIGIGNRVTVDCDGEKTTYEIVGATESDPASGKISSESPIAQSLVGMKKGDNIKVPIPDGEMDCKVLDIK